MPSSCLEFRPAKDQTKARAEAVQAARRYMRTDARINVRLSSADLEMVSGKDPALPEDRNDVDIAVDIDLVES